MHSNTSALKSSEPNCTFNLDISRDLGENNYLFIEGKNFLNILDGNQFSAKDIGDFQASWNDLKPDTYMADGGKYRLRRHATLTGAAQGGPVTLEKHQPHYKTTDYNNLNGGIERHFEPVLQSTLENPVMRSIVDLAAKTFGALEPLCTWHVEMHQFRIEALNTGGKPTPEGIHRDGVDFVAMVLVNRQNIEGGETTIVDGGGRKLAQFTLSAPFDAAFVNDLHVAHGVSPIMAVDAGIPGLRDVLVVTFRRK